MSILYAVFILALFAGLLAVALRPLKYPELRLKEPLPVPVAAFNALPAVWTLPQVQIRFNAALHEYLAEDGTRLPSVTEILKRVGIIDTAGLSREAARFGTAVHEATAAIDRGEKSLQDYAANDPMQPYLRAW